MNNSKVETKKVTLHQWHTVDANVDVCISGKDGNIQDKARAAAEIAFKAALKEQGVNANGGVYSYDVMYFTTRLVVDEQGSHMSILVACRVTMAI